MWEAELPITVEQLIDDSPVSEFACETEVIREAYAAVQVFERPLELSKLRLSPKPSFNFGPHDLKV